MGVLARSVWWLLPAILWTGESSENTPRCASGKACPHIMMVVVDDLGWNNVPWHNKDLESFMPESLELVRGGVELDRHYAYVYCSPSRSSLLSGRLPYHVNQVNLQYDFATSGIHEGMTTIPRKMKEAGYKTHAVGKWHAGMSTYAKTPHGRGFDTHLGYFEGAQDHFTQRKCIDLVCGLPNPAPPPWNKTYHSDIRDLWHTDKPAYGKTGTYGDEMYTQFVVDTLESHPLDMPIFFYIAFQTDHSPLQAPKAYIDKFPSTWTFDRRVYAAMGVYWDESLGRIVQTLKARGMWNQTLLVMTADNGGPVYPSPVPGFNHCGGANNFPLYGGKSSAFEGGVRVAAFAAGGVLPQQVRGTKLEANIHIADWFATFCGLAGVDPKDPAAVAKSLPDVDSLDVWPLLAGTESTSPRWEIPLAVGGYGADVFSAPEDFRMEVEAGGGMSGLIQGDFKLLGGTFSSAFHQAPGWPTDEACCDVTCWRKITQNCGTASAPRCLYNIRTDPTEQENVFDQHPDLVANMTSRLHVLEGQVFNPQRYDSANATATAIIWERYGGFIGPWQDLPQLAPLPGVNKIETLLV